MPRTRPPGQLDRLLDAAGRVFSHKGLQRARMTEIAQEAGVAPGTLYHYFESKDALFYYVLERGTADGPAEIPEPLPVPDPGRDRLEKLLRSRAIRAGRFPALDRALESARADDVHAELSEIVGELYDRLSRGKRVASVIEASTLDQPELSRIWFVGVRRALLQRLARYLELRSVAGQVRVLENSTVAARFVLETCVYFARQRHGDPYPEDLPDGKTVRSAVLDLVSQALVASSTR